MNLFTKPPFEKLILFYIVSLFSIANFGFANDTPPIIATPKIIGGGLVSPGNWPFMTALTHKNVDPIYGQFCGASLVDQQWALTAAHCVADLSASDLEIVVGRHQLSLDDGEIIPVSEILIHEYYNPVTFDSDIALLKLERPTEYSPIQTLGRFSIQDKRVDKPATVLGWGDTSIHSRFFPDFLHQVDLPLIANSECNPQTSGVTDNMLCLGVLDGSKDSCNGDSGGPAFVLDPENGRLQQIGIVSFGFGCARRNFSGVYTRVSEFTNFISDAVCSEETQPDTPELTITVEEQTVTASWTTVPTAQGYRLNYAPYPDMDPIRSVDLNQQNQFTITLPSGSAFFVAINAYNHNCRSEYSNIEHFIVP